MYLTKKNEEVGRNLVNTTKRKREKDEEGVNNKDGKRSNIDSIQESSMTKREDTRNEEKSGRSKNGRKVSDARAHRRLRSRSERSWARFDSPKRKIQPREKSSSNASKPSGRRADRSTSESATKEGSRRPSGRRTRVDRRSSENSRNKRQRHESHPTTYNYEEGPNISTKRQNNLSGKFSTHFYEKELKDEEITKNLTEEQLAKKKTALWYSRCLELEEENAMLRAELAELKLQQGRKVEFLKKANQIRKDKSTVLSKMLENEDYIFKRDAMLDSESEKLQYETYKKVLTDEKMTFRDISYHRSLGDGSFGHAHLCEINHEAFLNSEFAVKCFRFLSFFSHHVEERKSMITRELHSLPYHRNVASVLGVISDTMENLPMQIRKVGSQHTGSQYDGVSVPLFVMPCYFKSLSGLIRERGFLKSNFLNTEIVYMLLGLLRGVHFLHRFKVVHRDLHPGNAFVDPRNGRIWIGDFGLSLDLKENETGFNVHRSNPILFSSCGITTCYRVVGGMNAQGFFLPPEILDFESKDEEASESGTYLNYEKCDLFSVGVIGYNLVSEKVGCQPFPFGLREDGTGPVVKNRKKYVDLNEIHSGFSAGMRRLGTLIRELLKIRIEERVEHGDALECIEQITKMVEKENRGYKKRKKKRKKVVKKKKKMTMKKKVKKEKKSLNIKTKIMKKKKNEKLASIRRQKIKKENDSSMYARSRNPYGYLF